MIDRYLPVLQEHSLDFVNSLPELIDTLNAHSDDSEDWATKVGQTVIAIRVVCRLTTLIAAWARRSFST